MDGRQLTAESVPVFQEGIGLLLSRWSALQMAVENEWGGRDSRRKADLLVSDISSFFANSKEPLYIDDLENILEESLLSLNTMAEDGSIEEVAEKLMVMHEECLEGNYQSIEKMRATNPPPVTHVRQVNDDYDDNDDDDDGMGDDNTTNMMLDVPNSGPILNPVDKPTDEPKSKQRAEAADDGWTVVSSRRNKGRKN
ncbi:hypothetical protein SLEP1_g19147 [Rubroshorea leprosula]|nr:hypothetical protein SLEP1_g19147 [Rubroshorea leprosula]